jgi:hypothetical protein
MYGMRADPMLGINMHAVHTSQENTMPLNNKDDTITLLNEQDQQSGRPVNLQSRHLRPVLTGPAGGRSSCKFLSSGAPSS